ncbi:hypothetical protein A0H81_09423 [Grifola frondosa]|uniref:Uncharacterized protein n=1 Tax=Grifola frondosa TaxID=5627 RepID=A0A1C7M2C9_GRIFR|nr:hypothetical protein A0H81_09423 [Grifola frondosa]
MSDEMDIEAQRAIPHRSTVFAHSPFAFAPGQGLYQAVNRQLNLGANIVPISAAPNDIPGTFLKDEDDNMDGSFSSRVTTERLQLEFRANDSQERAHGESHIISSVWQVRDAHVTGEIPLLSGSLHARGIRDHTQRHTRGENFPSSPGVVGRESLQKATSPQPTAHHKTPSSHIPASGGLPNVSSRHSHNFRDSSHASGGNVPVPEVPNNGGGHNNIPASRDDILELRKDMREFGHQMGRFADALETWVSKQTREHEANHHDAHTPPNGMKPTETRGDDGGDDGSTADTEDHTPLIPTRARKKTTGFPKPRAPDAVSLAREVQHHARLLMNRESSGSPFDPQFLASESEVLEYTPSSGYCCTADNFRPDLDSPPGSPWNKSVIRVFVNSFLEMGLYTCTDRDEIATAFQTHLKHLRRIYQKNIMSDLEVDQQKRVAKRAERQRNLYHRRLESAAKHSELRRHVGILMDLGISSMSSDESEHENGVTEYRVLIKPWRNPILTPWLRTFDAAYRKSRLGPGNTSTRGAHPHLRIASQKVDASRSAQGGLPINAYNPRWLETLSDFELDVLSPKSSPYNFSHTASIMMMAQSHNGDHHKTRPYV